MPAMHQVKQVPAEGQMSPDELPEPVWLHMSPSPFDFQFEPNFELKCDKSDFELPVTIFSLEVNFSEELVGDVGLHANGEQPPYSDTSLQVKFGPVDQLLLELPEDVPSDEAIFALLAVFSYQRLFLGLDLLYLGVRLLSMQPQLLRLLLHITSPFGDFKFILRLVNFIKPTPLLHIFIIVGHIDIFEIWIIRSPDT